MCLQAIISVLTSVDILFTYLYSYFQNANVGKEAQKVYLDAVLLGVNTMVPGEVPKAITSSDVRSNDCSQRCKQGLSHFLYIRYQLDLTVS